MRIVSAVTSLATIAVVSACTAAPEKRGELVDSGSASARSSSGVITRPAMALLSRAELALFDTLPTTMNAGGGATTSAQVSLGRRLFHETLLSNGHDVSCNSCHALNGYGADGRRVSFGSIGHVGGRNAPTVYNAAGHIAQFWDGRAASVEEQAKGPILNAVEMGMPNSAAVLDHLKASPVYVAEFKAAFPADAAPINYDNVGRAIGAFERGLVTPSRWDHFLAGDSSALTPTETQGLATFVRTGCASCHTGAYVGGQLYRKLGLAKAWPTSLDSGRIAVTRNVADLFVFKVPSLRNVAMTGPYFHDGSIASLDQAIRLMGRHQLGVELDSVAVTRIHAWLGSLTGELPAAYIAAPQQPAPRR